MITVCVPTKNRAPFVRRLLAYFAATRFSGHILIGDSSDAEHGAQTRAAVEAARRSLVVGYHEYPGLSSCECLEQLAARVTTPCCVFVGDDDFLCTPGVMRCVEELQRHPEYGAVHGTGIILHLDRPGPHGTIIGLSRYPQAILHPTTGAGRLRKVLLPDGGAVFYAVHRTEHWRAMFAGVSQMAGTTNRNLFKDELMATCVSAIRGRIVEINDLSLVRQSHDGIYRHPVLYDWVTDDPWLPSFRVFQARLVEELARQDGLSTDDAAAVVREMFWRFLAEIFFKEWHRTYEKPRIATAPSRVRAALKRLPGLRSLKQRVMATVQRRRDPLSLPALLDPSSPHHRAFLPIYQAVTTLAEATVDATTSSPEWAATVGETRG